MKDRKPKYPGRVLLTPENGSAPFYAIMTRADEPEEDGDAINKHNLLQDTTAEAMGLDPANNPQVNDALWKLNFNHQYRYKVGDIITTIRTDLGENWALCNGDTIFRDDGKTNADLYRLLNPGIDERTRPPELGNSIIVQMKNGLWNDAGEGGSGKSAVINPLTGERQEISISENGLEGSDIIGITWNGAEYVCCTIYASTHLIFYTSSDLITWTEAARFEPSNPPGWSQNYGWMRFLWDGAAYRVNYWYNGYQAQRLITFDAEFNYVSSGGDLSDDKAIYAADGLFCIGYSYDATLYEPGSTEPLHTTTSATTDDGKVVFEKYADNKYVMVPVSRTSTLAFFNKSTNIMNRMDIHSFFYSVQGTGLAMFYPYYCTNVLLDAENGELVFCFRDNDATDFAEARISIDADFTVKENYVFTAAEKSDEMTYLLKHGDNWTKMSIDKMRGPHPRVLPTITHDECYTYIKVEEGQ